MTFYTEFFKRLQRLMPNHIKPKFDSDEGLLAWNQEQGRLSSESILRENKAMKMQRVLGRSGIRELYMNCSFDNYKIEHDGQRKVLQASKRYAEEFHKNIASFIFSGKPGTGKNHLASAIGNYLILHGKSILIVTVADLMSNMKGTFSGTSNITEENLLHNLSSVDLLMIDEIGMQTESRYEKVIINQIVDRRSSSKRSTGMLSNLDHKGMKTLLGERVIDRMRLGNSLWLTFEWDSYRQYVKGNEY
ncbi:DNA replication protein DnaC [Buchnera aphidicola]|uniref:Replicative helicase loader DnaC n=1 Tax=Buchnera aphidicola str. USDA (Myzus persicae) TaxID=1009856 RepID=W0P5L3_BUCMP|nr:DNA replication protein DnaC [Buchnera aphidicola]AHG60338.1 Dnac [Buchnera aphidicola str. USDA (Myzus persicae)]AHG60916.1 Dnac [Buchnera aphidicola str. W106 (Myzus persicae)]AHG61488.1 Dnac [Buchnera aphidicola str. G002 (Myzus persicae)]AHG62061.1 Dnac [Buchnera aphidicola str. F009 (Myzus persicae)]WAI02975.1 MAG: DNA replication protein DnaC [Buchnera aphidicola (Myzus persicae)]